MSGGRRRLTYVVGVDDARRNVDAQVQGDAGARRQAPVAPGREVQAETGSHGGAVAGGHDDVLVRGQVPPGRSGELCVVKNTVLVDGERAESAARQPLVGGEASASILEKTSSGAGAASASSATIVGGMLLAAAKKCKALACARALVPLSGRKKK